MVPPRACCRKEAPDGSCDGAPRNPSQVGRHHAHGGGGPAAQAAPVANVARRGPAARRGGDPQRNDRGSGGRSPAVFRRAVPADLAEGLSSTYGPTGIPAIGLFRGAPPADPWKVASP